MTDHATVYDVQERTGNPTHASVDRVCERLLDRAAALRTDHSDAHLDETMATVIDRYGDAVVREVIHRILVDGVPFRTAAADHNVAPLDGVRIGTVAMQVLSELNTDPEASLKALGSSTSRDRHCAPRACGAFGVGGRSRRFAP